MQIYSNAMVDLATVVKTAFMPLCLWRRQNCQVTTANVVKTALGHIYIYIYIYI